MKKYLKLLTTLLVMAFLCMSCGGNGSVNSTEKESNANSEEEPSNPLNIIGMTPVYEMSSDGKECYLKYITLQTPNGDYMYDDEDADSYYNDLAGLFFLTYMLANKAEMSVSLSDKKNDIREYLKDHLFDVVTNLPLDSSYPERIREFANKVYYDNKDKDIYVEDKGYGYVKYLYQVKFNGKIENWYFKVGRTEDDGRFIIKYGGYGGYAGYI